MRPAAGVRAFLHTWRRVRHDMKFARTCSATGAGRREARATLRSHLPQPADGSAVPPAVGKNHWVEDQCAGFAAVLCSRMVLLRLIVALILLNCVTQATLLITTIAIARPSRVSESISGLLLPLTRDRILFRFAEAKCDANHFCLGGVAVSYLDDQASPGGQRGC